MSKIENLKLRKIEVLDSIGLMSANSYNGSSGDESPIDGGSLKEVEIWGSAGSGNSGSWSGFGSYDWGSSWYNGSYNWDFGSDSNSGPGYGSYNTSGQCRIVEASFAPAIGAAWGAGEIVAAVSTIGVALFAIMLCFTSDVELYKTQCLKLYEACQNRGGSDSLFHNGQSRCDACRVECLSSCGKTWNCQS